jgi:hypothetical protein
MHRNRACLLFQGKDAKLVLRRNMPIVIRNRV